jgi:8-amino-7-oxononanoate synthase
MHDNSLNDFAKNQLAIWEKKRLIRTPISTERLDYGMINRGGENLVSFACNDYLGLTQHAKVKAAAIRATEKYGTGSGSSRLITGSNPLYGELEQALANYHNKEAAIIFSSGYLTNLGIIQTLMNARDLVVFDEFSHASLIDGIKISRAHFLRFSHNDVKNCAEIFSKKRAKAENAMLISEHVFSMEGTRAPISALSEIAKTHQAWFLIDDAHGFATLEKPGHTADLWVGTLSKTLASIGGYVCAKREIIDYLKTAVRPGIYSTALPPAALAAALAALEIIKSDADLAKKPLQNAKNFCAALNLPAPESPIVPLIIGDIEKTFLMSAELQEAGFFVSTIRPPTVKTARLRFTFSAVHSSNQIEQLSAEVKRLQKKYELHNA